MQHALFPSTVILLRILDQINHLRLNNILELTGHLPGRLTRQGPINQQGNQSTVV